MALKKTITTTFIVPLVIKRDKLSDNGFVNGYIKDLRRDVQYKNSVYLLFKPIDLDKFRNFVDAEGDKIVDDYDYEDGYVVLVYSLPSKFKNDIDLIKQGKYSETSTKFQEAFPKIIKIMKNGLHRDEISLQYRIFKKSLDLKELWEAKIGEILTDDMEVWPGWIDEKEELNLEKVKEQFYENA
jgi:hypothetical protein